MLLQKFQRRFLLAMPLIAVPFLIGIFYALGGGKGAPALKAGSGSGLNTELPGAFIDPRKFFLNKVGAYDKANQDSLRKQAFVQQDPYRRVIPPDPKATELLAQLSRIRQSLHQPPPPVTRVASPVVPPYVPILRRPRIVDTPTVDPQLERLNTMLDKVIRIQHPEESRPMSGRTESSASDMVAPADSASNAIAAVIPSDQTLVAGETVPLRLAEDIIVHGIRIAGGTWLYGTVSISGDRMLVHVRSIRDGRNLYATDLQVYDLDGLPGIHIPDVLSQDVAKESATESVSGINLLTTEPGLGAEAANAGIQAAKSLLARKARLTKVAVRAGYEVLLKNSNNSFLNSHKDQSVRPPAKYQPPGFVPGGPFLERSRSEGVELKLRGIYLQDSLLWFALEWENHSPISYTPQYYRWVIRDRRSFKRTAQQELPMEPVYSPELTGVGCDSELNRWVGFRPFAPGKDKELVLEVGEKRGGRELTLIIHPRQILNAKIIENEKTETTAEEKSAAKSGLHAGGVRNDQDPMEEIDLPEL